MHKALDLQKVADLAANPKLAGSNANRTILLVLKAGRGGQ